MANVLKTDIDVDIAYNAGQTVTQTVAQHSVTAAEAGGQLIRVEASIQFYRIGSNTDKPPLEVELNIKKNNVVEANRAISDTSTNHSYPIDATLTVNQGDIISLEIVGTNQFSRGDAQVYKYTGRFNLVTHDVTVPTVVTRPPTTGVMGIEQTKQYIADRMGATLVAWRPDRFPTSMFPVEGIRSYLYSEIFRDERWTTSVYRRTYYLELYSIAAIHGGPEAVGLMLDRSQEFLEVIKGDHTLGGRCLRVLAQEVRTRMFGGEYVGRRHISSAVGADYATSVMIIPVQVIV